MLLTGSCPPAHSTRATASEQIKIAVYTQDRVLQRRRSSKNKPHLHLAQLGLSRVSAGEAAAEETGDLPGHTPQLSGKAEGAP